MENGIKVSYGTNAFGYIHQAFNIFKSWNIIKIKINQNTEAQEYILVIIFVILKVLAFFN